MKRTAFLTLFLCSLIPLPAGKTEIHPFFQRILLRHPSLPQLEFQVSAGNHATAFLTLTHWLSRSLPLEEYLALLPEAAVTLAEGLIEQQDERFGFAPLLAEIPGELERFIALAHIMTTRYQRNRLSGVWSEKGWSLLFEQIETALRTRKPGPTQAALLHLARRMSFFKDSRKWGKRSARILKKAARTPGLPFPPLAAAVLAAR